MSESQTPRAISCEGMSGAMNSLLHAGRASGSSSAIVKQAQGTSLVTWQYTPLSCTDLGTQSDAREAADSSTAPTFTTDPGVSSAS